MTRRADPLSQMPDWKLSDRRADPRKFEPVGDAEAERAARYRRQDDARDYLHARWLMRQLAARCLPGLTDPQLESFDDARPIIHGHAETGVSWSRSGPVACAALLKGGLVGIDVEQIEDRDTAAILGMVARPQEAELIHSIKVKSDHLAAFHRLWTAKEAILKCRGEGLRGGAKSVEVPAEYLTGAEGNLTIHDRAVELCLMRLDVGNEACCSLAFSAQKPT